MLVKLLRNINMVWICPQTMLSVYKQTPQKGTSANSSKPLLNILVQFIISTPLFIELLKQKISSTTNKHFYISDFSLNLPMKQAGNYFYLVTGGKNKWLFKAKLELNQFRSIYSYSKPHITKKWDYNTQIATWFLIFIDQSDWVFIIQELD